MSDRPLVILKARQPLTQYQTKAIRDAWDAELGEMIVSDAPAFVVIDEHTFDVSVVPPGSDGEAPILEIRDEEGGPGAD